MLAKAALLSSAFAAVSGAAIGTRASAQAQDMSPFDASRTYGILAVGGMRGVVHKTDSLTLMTMPGLTGIYQYTVTHQGKSKYSLMAADSQPNEPIQIDGAEEGKNVKVGKSGSPTTFEFHAIDKPSNLNSQFDWQCFLIKVPDQDLAWDSAKDQGAQASVRDSNDQDTDGGDQEDGSNDQGYDSGDQDDNDGQSQYNKRDGRIEPYIQLAAVDYGKTSQRFCFRQWQKPNRDTSQPLNQDGSSVSSAYPSPSQTGLYDDTNSNTSSDGYPDSSDDTSSGDDTDSSYPASSDDTSYGTQTSSAYDSQQTDYGNDDSDSATDGQDYYPAQTTTAYGSEETRF